jgi:hypothetical protein
VAVEREQLEAQGPAVALGPAALDPAGVLAWLDLAAQAA